MRQKDETTKTGRKVWRLSAESVRLAVLMALAEGGRTDADGPLEERREFSRRLIATRLPNRFDRLVSL